MSWSQLFRTVMVAMKVGVVSDDTDEQNAAAGNDEVALNFGHPASGSFFRQIGTDSFAEIRKMLLTK